VRLDTGDDQFVGPRSAKRRDQRVAIVERRSNRGGLDGRPFDAHRLSGLPRDLPRMPVNRAPAKQRPG